MGDQFKLTQAGSKPGLPGSAPLPKPQLMLSHRVARSGWRWGQVPCVLGQAPTQARPLEVRGYMDKAGYLPLLLHSLPAPSLEEAKGLV